MWQRVTPLDEVSHKCTTILYRRFKAKEVSQAKLADHLLRPKDEPQAKDLTLLNTLSLTQAWVVFGLGALVVLFVGTKLTAVADQLADRTGLGEAIAGGVLLGAVTSLPGVVVSVTAGLSNRPDLALGNAIGGIAVQTLFLAVADLFYTRANLEHAAASLVNILQGGLLIVLLGLIGVGRFMPDVTILGAHPVSWILILAYGYGLHIVSQAKEHPMWKPQDTDETRHDVPEGEADQPSLKALWIRFVPMALALASVGWILERVTGRITELSALEDSTAGLLITSTCTSLPELVTSVAAVRRGALTLAVGGIIGGNTFDTLFSTAADFAYQDGSLYHAVSEEVVGWIMLNVIMMAVLVVGLLRREKYGVARIGLESAMIITCYLAGVLTLAH